ncbi:PaaX family transcriptional regulator [Actinocrispum wychmicini]|uniref:PaaX family transcriptional regulator n=1 Tax=Actinocrispum wychmicini TaxID=1213861 RepID=UPI001FB7EC38|nr:PaaX family transcriptional regulator C-terminal domain-containing protein [Actinocrispum wychmicini]
MTAVPETVQPRHLIVTVYGLYARETGGWMSVARIISLLADLNVDEPAVRSSISRLKRRGMLEPVRKSVAGYQLSTEAEAILREGDHRIFQRDRATLADGWLLAVFSVPESERYKRHLLRTQLTRLGFGTTTPGVWIAPANLRDTTEDMLRRLDLARYADLFHSDHLAFGDLRTKIRLWWDLDQLERLYEDFVRAHSRRRPRTDREAFADYVRLLTDWRRLPYLDPGLPKEVLPPRWIGIRAADTFFTLQAQLAERAKRHAVMTS